MKTKLELISSDLKIEIIARDEGPQAIDDILMLFQ